MQFLNPLFFIGLVAVAIPIAVHLFNFRRYKKVYFSDISRLEEIAEETKRQSRIKERLIMAARILAIVFLVTAFARPCIPSRDSAATAGSNLVAVYIDNSFSMEDGTSSGTLLENAKQKAREIAAGYSLSDRFMLITNDLNGSQFSAVSAEEIGGIIDEVQVSPKSPALSTVAKRISAALNGDHSAAMHSAYFISDFQKSAADISNFPHDTLTHSYLVPLKGSVQNNIFIDSLAFSAPVFTKGNVVNVSVFVRNSGNEDVDDIPVKLTVNDKERAIASANIARNSKTTVRLQFTIDENEILNGRVSIADHPITFDDEMFFSINPTAEIKVLSINENADNQYIKHLLGNDSLLRYKSCKSTAAAYENFGQYNLIIVNEIATFRSGLSDALATFAQKGGTVLVLPSKGMDVGSFNDFAQRTHLPKAGSFVENAVKVSKTNTSHPLFRNVFERSTNDFEQPSVSGYFKATSSNSTVKEDIMTLANGDCLLSFSQTGKGGVYVLWAPLEAQFTDFGKTALFVPTIYNMALFNSSVPAFYHVIGDEIELTTDFTNNDSPLKISSLDGATEIIPEMTGTANGQMMRTHDNLQTAGNYLVTQDGKTLQGISFNYSRRESEMDFLSEKELSDAIKALGNSYLSIIKDSGKPLEKLIRDQREGKPLWHIFIILSLAMLAAEICLIKFLK